MPPSSHRTTSPTWASLRPGRRASRGRGRRCRCSRGSRERFAADRPLDGVSIGICLHVTAETATLARALAAGGADVALCAANPLSTQDDVAAALVSRRSPRGVRAARGGPRRATPSTSAALVAREPDVTLDDGADLITVLHDARPDVVERMRGATEETTTGLVRLRAMEAEGRLACPVIAVNEARTERAFNDRYGTGQSTIDGILRATNVLLAGAVVVVVGYGWTGKGIALRAHGPRRQRDRLRGRPDPRARGADGGLPGHDRARWRPSAATSSSP